MHINDGQLTTAFYLTSSTPQEKVREPVTIDVKASFAIDESTAAADARIVNDQKSSNNTINDQQQAHFIRFFSSNDSAINANEKISSPVTNLALPQAVQQYVQVAATTSLEVTPTLLDETI